MADLLVILQGRNSDFAKIRIWKSTNIAAPFKSAPLLPPVVAEFGIIPVLVSLM